MPGKGSLAATLWRALAVVGDASYALYLFHAFPIRAVIYPAIRWGLDMDRLFWLFLLVATAAAIAMAILIHYLFERPVTRALRGRLARQVTVASA